MAAIGPRLELRQTVALVISPQLRQAIKLLQLSNLEAARFVSEELERNPLLERGEAEGSFVSQLPAPDQRAVPPPAEIDSAALISSENLPAPQAAPLDAGPADAYEDGDGWAGVGHGAGTDDDEPGERVVEGVAGNPPSLREHLSLQLRLAFSDPTERLIGAHLISQLDQAGRLPVEPAALAAALGSEVAAVERVRHVMLRFDPTGCFARDLKECLAVQLAERNRLDPAMAALLDHLDLLARREMRELMVLTGVDADDLADMLAELRRLDPKPGTRFEAAPLATLVPDILMHATPDGDFRLELNGETLPRVLVNHVLYGRISASAHRAERTFLSERMAAANWLVRALAQRADTILKVATEIVRTQEDFFRRGVAYLHPLTLREIAEIVGVHESTVSRVTANKYIATPRGIFELKYFFTPAINGTDGENHSAEAVRCRIKALIHAERPGRVLSDDAIVHALRIEGVDIARRTVAKYREALHIPSSPQRRREKGIPA